MTYMQSPFVLHRRRTILDVIFAHWSKLIVGIRDPYRPELHYMRGPGPRWGAKHQGRAGP